MVIDHQPFRFVGANVAVMYRDEDRAPDARDLASGRARSASKSCAFGLPVKADLTTSNRSADFNDWPRTHSFRKQPGEWNEAEFVFLDQVLAEAAKNNLRVQLCLTNWWRDTGGVTQYLRWAGINGADDDKFPTGINVEKAMQFYTQRDNASCFIASTSRRSSRVAIR